MNPIFFGLNQMPSGVWTPGTSSAMLWAKFDAATVLNDEDNLDAWTSEVGKNFAIINGSFHPLYKITIINGKAVMRNPVADAAYGLKTAAFDSALTPPYTIGIVFCLRGLTQGAIYDGILGFGKADFYAKTSTGKFSLYAGDAEISTGVDIDTNPHSSLIEWNGPDTLFTFDGGPETPVSGTPGSNNLAGLSIGNDGGGTGSSQVDIGEVAVWSGALSAPDKAAWFDYTSSRWGV